MKAELFYKSKAEIGEGITWLSESNLLLWVDIENGLLYQCDMTTNHVEEVKFGERISTIAPIKDNDLIIAGQSRLIQYNTQTKEKSTIVELDLPPLFRPNDGKASPDGRLFFGVMNMENQYKNGALYCIDKKLNLTKLLSDQCIPNGIVWNKAKNRIFYADSGRNCIEAYTYNRGKGSIEFERTVVQIPHILGVPDGMTIDRDDNLWVAHWGGFGVYVWSTKTGNLLQKIEVEAPNVASCTFGEDNTLFITTARAGLSREELEKYPLSGSIFKVKTKVNPGTNHYPFRLKI